MLGYALALGVGCLAALYAFLAAWAPVARKRLPEECRYYSPDAPREAQDLSSINDQLAKTVSLSLVIPAYNEAVRLPVMLSEAMDHLEKRKRRAVNKYEGDYEIIVVDDGSTDDTAETALQFGIKYRHKGGSNIRVVKLVKNRGKGGAVTHGMLFTRGRLAVFADADAASKFSDLDALEESLRKIRTDTHHGIAVGSRAHMVKTAAVVQRSALRNFLMRSFHLYLFFMGVSSVKDTQCGFKLFTRKSARAIFSSMHVEGWIFDVEALIIAGKLNIPVAEVPIAWKEVEGSKVSLVRDSIKMAIDLLSIRFQYVTGRWAIKSIDSSG